MDAAKLSPTCNSSSLEQWLAAAVMALLALITLGNVIVRYLTAYSFAFTEELSVALLLALALLGSTAALVANRHIRVTFFVERLPAAWQPVCERIALAATVLLFGLLVALGARMTWDDYRFEVTSPGLGIPQWLYTLWLPLLALPILLRMAVELWRSIRRVKPS